jgi:hypothetical protein
MRGNFMPDETFATRARSFIADVELPPAPPRTRASRTAFEGAAPDPDASPALAVGQNLVEFTGETTPALRAAVTDALLLAQLAADKQNLATPDQWYEAHRSVLMHLGFLGEGLTRTAQDFSSQDADLHEAILPVITAAFAGAAVPVLVMQTLKQLSEASEGKPWITLFERESRRFNVRQFQISLVEATPTHQEVSMLGFVMDIAQGSTQVLFFRSASDTVAVERIEGKFSAEASSLLEFAPNLAAKLAGRRQSYLQALEI